MKYVQLIRSRGNASLSNEEEALRSQIETTFTVLKQSEFRNKVEELLLQVEILKSSQKPLTSKVADKQLSFEIVDDLVVDKIFRTLQDMQDGLANLTSILQQDGKILEKLSF
jgi:hypothetical protein